MKRNGANLLFSAAFFCVFASLFSFAIASKSLAQNGYVPLDPWRGEYLQQGYGAFYTKLKLQGFKKSSRSHNITTNVFLHFHDDKENRRYIVSQSLQEPENGVQIWKMPVGNYLLSKISMSDASGRLRNWVVNPKAPGKSSIGIRYLFLSNMGVINLSPVGNSGLMIRVQGQANAFKNSFRHEAFAGVIDAYSMKVQEKLGGRNLFADASDEFASSDEVRAAFTFQRQITMIYKLDIGKQRRYTRKLVNTIAAEDLDLRRCYMDELEKTSDLKGNVAFNFVIERSTGAMQKIQYRGGNIKNGRLISCLYYTMGKMQFPVAENLAGNIRFYFSFTEEPSRRSP